MNCVVTNWPRLIGGSKGIHQDPKTHFSSPSQILVVDRLRHPLFCNILTNNERKMSQSFGKKHNSFNTSTKNSNTKDPFNKTYISPTYIIPTVPDGQPNILAWLSPLDPKLRHQDIRDCRVENIGEWVLQTEEFRSWYAGSEGWESDNAILFCYGNPGVGKTYIW